MGSSLNELLQRVRELEAEHRRDWQIIEEKDRFCRNLFEDSLGLMCVHDLDGVLLSINPAAAKSLGYRPQDGIGKNLRSFLVPSARHLFDAYLERIRSNPTDSGLMRLQARDETERIWMYRNVRYKEAGTPPRVLGHALDVTARVQAERNLKESERRFRTMADKAPVMIWIADAAGNCTFFNQPWLEFAGSDLNEDVPSGWIRKLHPEEFERWSETWRSASAEPGAFRAEFRFRRVDGAYRWLLLSGVPLGGPGRDLRGYVVSGVDITESKEDKEALRRANDEVSARVAERTAELQTSNERLQAEMLRRESIEEELLRARKMESIGLLAGRVAHDFNNVLTAVSGNIALAQMEMGTSREGLEALKDAAEACRRAVGLTSQLLVFARGGAPVRQIESVAHIVEECLRLTAPSFEKQPVVHIPDGLLPVNVDRRQIVQALCAVVRNAFESKPPCANVRVQVENAVVNDNVLPVASGRYVRITVEDDGLGIPPEDLPKVFDPYFSTKPGGLGLGLATAYAIIGRHSGHITVDSAPGAGTAFRIYLPVTPEESEIAGTGARKTVLRARTGRVLIMDDEESLRKLTAQVLVRSGYEVETAAEGGQAVAAFEKARTAGRPFDLVLLDLTVPAGMGGSETVRRLRQIDPDVKAIVCSGYSDDPVMSNYANYGFAGVLMKPWSVPDLRTLVERHIGA